MFQIIECSNGDYKVWFDFQIIPLCPSISKNQIPTAYILHGGILSKNKKPASLLQPSAKAFCSKPRILHPYSGDSTKAPVHITRLYCILLSSTKTPSPRARTYNLTSYFQEGIVSKPQVYWYYLISPHPHPQSQRQKRCRGFQLGQNRARRKNGLDYPTGSTRRLRSGL